MSEAVLPSKRTTGLLARAQRMPLARLLLKLQAALALILLVVVFSLTTSTFLTPDNFSILVKQVAISALLAIGMTFVMLTGGIDLSVGSIAGLSGMTSGLLIYKGVVLPGHAAMYPPIALVVVGALAVAALVGLINGLLVTRLSIEPFIATLGTLYIIRGAALLISNGRTFPDLAGVASRHNTGFTSLGQAFWLGIPMPVWITLAVGGVSYVVASRTIFGRHVYAVGGNERAAFLAGIPVARVKLLTYVISAVCAGIAGLLIASELEVAHPATGTSFELNAIAAVVLGGASLQGGVGTILGSLLGACVIGVLADGLVMLGVSEFWQMVIKGAVIILAVAVDQLQSRMGRRAA